MWKKTKYKGICRDGKRIRIRVQVKSQGQKSYQNRSRVFTGINVNQALDIQRQWREELEIGQEAPERMTLGDYAKRWIEDCAVRDRHSTMERKIQALELHVLPILKDYYLDELRGMNLKDWQRAMISKRKGNGKPYSRDTINGWTTMLKALVRAAVQELQLPADPTCVLKPLPVIQSDYSWKEKTNSLSAEEARRFLQAAKELYLNSHYPMIRVALIMGARFGEYSALTWEDINEESRLIWITKAHVRGILGRTKTGSIRSVALDEETLQMLRNHRRRLIEVQHPGLKSGLVFPSDVGGYRNPSCLLKPFKAILAKAEISRRITVKGLRRTHINLMRQMGAGRIALRASVGHSSERMTEHYSDVTPEEKKGNLAGLMGLIRC